MKELTLNLVLILPDLRKAFQVQVEACGNNGIGVVLMQEGHVVAHESRILQPAEKHLQIYED